MSCILLKPIVYPPRFRKGSGLLAVVLVLSLVCAILAVGTAKVSQASMNSTASNKITVQAQQFAASQAELMRTMKYADMQSKSKETIGNTKYKREIKLGRESSYSSTVKQREVDINIFYDNESLPRASATFTRYNVPSEAGGCQIVSGTNNVSFTANGNYKSITAIASATFVPLDGSWTGSANYGISLDSKSLGTFSCTTTTQKGGSKGHYWGTTHNVTNQKTVNVDVPKGSTVSVKLTGSSRLNFSTVTVILGN